MLSYINSRANESYILLGIQRKLHANSHPPQDYNTLSPFKAVWLKQCIILLKSEIRHGCDFFLLYLLLRHLFCSLRSQSDHLTLFHPKILSFTSEEKLIQERKPDPPNRAWILSGSHSLIQAPCDWWRSCFSFKLEYPSEVHTVLRCMVILLPQPPKCWNSIYEPWPVPCAS